MSEYCKDVVIAVNLRLYVNVFFIAVLYIGMLSWLLYKWMWCLQLKSIENVKVLGGTLIICNSHIYNYSIHRKLTLQLKE